MSHIYAHTDSFLLHLTLSLTLSLKNNQVHTFLLTCSIFSSHSLLKHIYSAYRSNTLKLCLGGLGILWYLVVFFALRVLSLSLPCILGLGRDTLAVCSVFECFCQFAGIAFDACHPSLLLHFCKWDNMGPHLHCSGFGVGALGLADLVSWGSMFTGGLGFVAVTVLLVGRIGQSFLSFKKIFVLVLDVNEPIG